VGSNPTLSARYIFDFRLLISDSSLASKIACPTVGLNGNGDRKPRLVRLFFKHKLKPQTR
jgi:hypothetical protein